MLKHLQPLPISEEMLGAYLEGNLSVEEVGYVESVLQSDRDVMGLVDEVGDLGMDWMRDFVGDSEFELPADMLIDFDIPGVNMHLLDSEWESSNDEVAEVYTETQEPGCSNNDDFFEL